MDSTRYDSGLARLRQIDGEAGEKVIESLQAIAPDLARYVIAKSLFQAPSAMSTSVRAWIWNAAN